jgi:hypothetical protein
MDSMTDNTADRQMLQIESAEGYFIQIDVELVYYTVIRRILMKNGFRIFLDPAER